MKLSTVAALLFTLVGASAQTLNTTYIEAIGAALVQANLTAFAGIAENLVNTTEGAALFAALPGSNKTVLVPNNQAFANSNLTSGNVDPTTILTTLSYHIFNTSISPSQISTSPNHTLVRSLYNSGELPGNRSEPVVFTKFSSSSSSGNSSSSSSGGNSTGITILQATSNVTILAGPVQAANLVIYVIDTVLTLPGDLATAATGLVPALGQVISSSGLLDPLNNFTGLTVFAPDNDAIGAISSSLGSLDATSIQTILANHVIEGAVVYSPLLSAGNFTSASGEPFTFSKNGSSVYVTSGGSTAKIVQSDIIISNGVVHVIDGVLLNNQSNPSAASSAEASYSSAATQTTGALGGGNEIGVATITSTIVASGSGGSSSSGGATSSKAAGVVGFEISKGVVGSALVGVLGMIVGALMI